MIEFTVPIRTYSEANRSEHWTKRHKRHQGQRLILNSFLNKHCQNVNLPIKIIITRIAPRPLDFDNLTMSVKFIRDSLAMFFIPGGRSGQNDSDVRFNWFYEQNKGIPKQYAIKINIIPITFDELTDDKLKKWQENILPVESTKKIRGY